MQYGKYYAKMINKFYKYINFFFLKLTHLSLCPMGKKTYTGLVTKVIFFFWKKKFVCKG